MDIQKAIKLKKAEIAKAQADLEALERAAQVLGIGKRGRPAGKSAAGKRARGRRKFTKEQKEAQAARMRAYWKARREGKPAKAKKAKAAKEPEKAPE